MSLFDVLFPKFCVGCKKISANAYICPDCFSKLSFDVPELCLLCKKAAIGGITHPICKTEYAIDGSFTAIAYHGVAKKLLYALKYKPYVTDLVPVLTELLYESLIQKESFYTIFQKEKQHIVLTPIPLSRQKQKSRGYNQAALLAKALGTKLDISVDFFLERIKQTISQVGLTEQQRKDNISGAFAINKQKNREIQKSVIVLVDDVLTTGATMREAAKVLKRNGAKKVYGLALARD